MFTGIVEAMGRVDTVEDREGLRRMTISCGAALLESVTPGDSIAVDGACLTPVVVESDRFTVELVASTLSRTVAGAYTAGHLVNLERAMRLDGRLDGHLVQGHVDGIGTLESITSQGETRFLDFRIPDPVWALTILHGSITLNGISLTVNALTSPDRCQVAIIPHTWEKTNLSALRVGDGVNVEGDLMGKYVRRLLEPHLTDSGD
ncbi:MAG: riboflavin synthase [Gemmatimonadota bacterium]